MGRKRLSGAERRVQLMRVGRGVFATRGYETGSLDEVSTKAGVTKPIVYEHFGSKEGLFAAIVEHEMDALVARMTEAISHGTARDRFENAVHAFMSYAKDEPAGFAVLSREAPAGSGRLGLTRVIDDLAARVSDVFLEEFARAGYSKKVAPIYANALVGMVTQVGQWWAAHGRRFSVAQVTQHVAALGWMGLRHLPRTPAQSLRRRSNGAARANPVHKRDDLARPGSAPDPRRR